MADGEQIADPGSDTRGDSPGGPATGAAKGRPPHGRGNWANLPLVAIWGVALLPFGLYLVHQSDPELAVRIANAGKLWGLRIVLAGTALALVAALLYPPFPAGLRRFVDRTRTSMTIDRAPLVRALSELQHLETAQRHYEVGRLMWLRRDFALCGPHLQRAVELEPSVASAQHLFGLFLLRIGELPQALITFANAEKLDPGHAFGDALLHQARAQHLLGQLEQALRTFEQHAQQHGGNRRSHFWHGEAMLSAGQPDAALQAFRTAAEPPKTRLTADENWFRAKARVRCWRLGGRA